MPILVSLLAIDIAWVIDNRSTLTLGNYVGYGLRVIILVVLGGVVAALNQEVSNPLSLVQLGIAAPALITAYINGSSATYPGSVPPLSNTATHSQQGGVAIFSSAYASEISLRPPIVPADFLGDVVGGFTRNLGQLDATNRAFRDQSVSGVTVEIDTDRPGGDYRNTDAPNLAECQKLCLADIQCRAYTFLIPNSNPSNWHGPPPPHCWLKNTESNPTRYMDFISGIRTGP